MTPTRTAGPRRRRRLDAPVSWHDVPTLRSFISDRGKIRSRRVTGLDPKQHRQIARAIKNAREMALLPYPAPSR